MIGYFSLHIFFYVLLGIIFLDDLDVFKKDATLLIHAGDLSNICLEIRRYEKNYIIRHDSEDFQTALNYVDEAIADVSTMASSMIIVPLPNFMSNLTAQLKEYKQVLQSYKNKCSDITSDTECESRQKLRKIGKSLINVSEYLVKFQQKEMLDFFQHIKTQFFLSVAFLIALTIITTVLLYYHIILPLKSIEGAARRVAKGTFTFLPVSKNEDEVNSVLHAFNSMVSDLEEKQEQLFQAKKLSSIGKLSSGIAHQINNPLNNISTSCQIAIEELEGNLLIRDLLTTIEQETQRAGDIVRGLLEFSRTQVLSMQSVLLVDVVRKVIQLVAGETPPGITLKQDIPEGLALRLDVQKMVEALLNLVINAIQSIQPPPGTVSITATYDEAEKQAIIEVEDDGSGIDPENLPKIFDPFFTTKTTEEGNGLGLAVVYGIIKKQKGAIKVESVKGQGTRFIITMPV
jgi:signal transduction histidine kinase